MKEIFQKYRDAIDPSLKLAEVPLGMIKLIAYLTCNDVLKYVVDLMTYFARIPEHPKERILLDILGIPSTTFKEWLVMEKIALGKT